DDLEQRCLVAGGHQATDALALVRERAHEVLTEPARRAGDDDRGRSGGVGSCCVRLLRAHRPCLAHFESTARRAIDAGANVAGPRSDVAAVPRRVDAIAHEVALGRLVPGVPEVTVAAV